MRGLIHIHTTFSYDGEASIEEICSFSRKRGYRFIAITEHSDNFSSKRMEVLVGTCEKLSNASFIAIPGIEFSCDGNMHLLGIGVTEICNSTGALEIVDHIRKSGGLAILAHPLLENYEIKKELASKLDGIEIWNAAKDGGFIPRSKALELFTRLRKENPRLLGFGGLDLHRLPKFPKLSISINNGVENSTESILRALKGGDFKIEGRYYKLNSAPDASSMTRVSILLLRKVLDLLKALRDWHK